MPHPHFFAATRDFPAKQQPESPFSVPELQSVFLWSGAVFRQPRRISGENVQKNRMEKTAMRF
jgi:hypothetical protein